MSLKSLLCIVCISLCVENGIYSYMGTEQSLRQNIVDVLKGKLKISDDNLPLEEDELSDSTPKNQSEYDFIVIGAGSAGATIASRLSEIKSVTVLLIEAGGREYSIIDIPSLSTAFQSNNDVSWNYEIESSDKKCLGVNSRKCVWPRGKIMGGSSSINHMLAMRGNRRDYDEWANETGDDSWSYQNMLKYFEKLEDFNESGRRGPVHISIARDRSKISETFMKGAKEMGFSEFDYNGPEQVGFSYYHTTTFQGERWSANRAYLRPVKNRRNLIVTQHSHVHKILIDKVTKSAYGVRYSKNGEIYEMKVKKEIILSAGTIGSPQILMLSGIGPEIHLRELNIDVIKDAPVGENLIDHVAYGRYLMFHVNDSSTVEAPNVLDPKDPSIKNYIRDRSGILSYGTSMNALTLFNADNLTDLHPNYELIFTAGNAMITNGSITSGTLKTYSILPILMRPCSRGKIMLRSNNPLDKPKIYPNYFEDPDDVRISIKGIRLAMKISETNALKKHGSEYQNFSSACDVHGIGSDEYWKCELRAQASTGAHPVGTCRMGHEDSSNAVVNSELKVIGVNGLRVADASIMPNIVCAHINIPVIAIGEKAADLIKMQHGCK